MLTEAELKEQFCRLEEFLDIANKLRKLTEGKVEEGSEIKSLRGFLGLAEPLLAEFHKVSVLTLQRESSLHGIIQEAKKRLGELETNQQEVRNE